MKRKSSDFINTIILTVLVLLLYRCYYYIGFSGYTTSMGYMALGIYVIMFIHGFRAFLYSDFKKERLIVICTFITFLLSCLLFNNKFSSFSRYLIPLSFISYFWLIKNKVSSSVVESVLVIAAVIYLFCWLYQVSQIPNTVFGNREIEINSGRGFARFWIVTKEHLPFLMFYALAMYNRCKKILWMVIAFVVFSVVILHVVRQMIVWSGVMAISYYFYVNKKSTLKLLLFLIILLIVLNYFTTYFTAIDDLMVLTQDSKNTVNSVDSDNIRIKAMLYVIKNYNTNLLTILFGSGFPTDGSLLANKILMYMNKGFYLDDLGFVGMYCNTGLISVLLYVMIFISIFKCKVTNEYLYLKFYLAYLVLSYLGSHTLTSNMVFVVFSIYILKVNQVKFCKNPISKRKLNNSQLSETYNTDTSKLTQYITSTDIKL